MASPLETYAQVILHSGCAIPPIGETESRLHRWDECRSQAFFLRVARKHQHKLKSNGLAIGSWITRERTVEVFHECIEQEDGWCHSEDWAKSEYPWRCETYAEILLGPVTKYEMNQVGELGNILPPLPPPDKG